ncbi:MAG: hypothetical protein GX604_06305 [Actinobacteria bacterium]|jgi:hypothetical protein|nr:hypothetical protein [Actinomycetota bacterium]
MKGIGKSQALWFAVILCQTVLPGCRESVWDAKAQSAQQTGPKLVAKTYIISDVPFQLNEVVAKAREFADKFAQRSLDGFKEKLLAEGWEVEDWHSETSEAGFTRNSTRMAINIDHFQNGATQVRVNMFGPEEGESLTATILWSDEDTLKSVEGTVPGIPGYTAVWLRPDRSIAIRRTPDWDPDAYVQAGSESFYAEWNAKQELQRCERTVYAFQDSASVGQE